MTRTRLLLTAATLALAVATAVLAPIALAADMSAAWAGPYAPQEYDFSELEGNGYGIIESVREVPLADPPAFPEVFEHALKPQTGDELLIRLDDGRAIEVMEGEMQRLKPGQRVRIRSDTSGTRVERE